MRYLYFDDEPPAAVKSYVDAITTVDTDGDLVIDHLSPRPWDEMVLLLREEQYDGVILDLRLDEMVMWDRDRKIKAQYRAQEIAQKIRVEASDSILADIPIVLWSTDQNLNNSGFSRDSTPKDLFDFKVVKTKIVDNARSIKMKLVALSNGYCRIGKCYNGSLINIACCLSIEDDEITMDPRVFSYFDSNFKPTVHDVARYILDHIIRIPGPFITSDLLATRLGVKISNSENWTKFAEKVLIDLKYKGVFSEGWDIYSMYLLQKWWTDVFAKHGSLRKLSSTQRVKIINDAYPEYGLKPIDPSESSPKGFYWYNCVATNKPVSQLDSFIVSNPHKLPWQENRYISFDAILKREDRTQGIRIDELDHAKFEKFKKDNS